MNSMPKCKGQRVKGNQDMSNTLVQLLVSCLDGYLLAMALGISQDQQSELNFLANFVVTFEVIEFGRASSGLRGYVRVTKG